MYNNDWVLIYSYVSKIVSVFNFFQIIIECLRGCFSYHQLTIFQQKYDRSFHIQQRLLKMH